MARSHSPKACVCTTSLCCAIVRAEVALRDNLMEGPSRTKVTPTLKHLIQDRSFFPLKIEEVHQSGVAAPWSSARLLFSCYPTIINIYFLPSLLDASQEERGKCRGTHLPLKGIAKKLHTSLFLTSPWPEWNPMTILVKREAGKCNLQLNGSVPIPGFYC